MFEFPALLSLLALVVLLFLLVAHVLVLLHEFISGYAVQQTGEDVAGRAWVKVATEDGCRCSTTFLRIHGYAFAGGEGVS